MNGDSKEPTQARHPIGVVSARTGLPQDVLRAWERRYEAVTPYRTDTGRRLYTDRDLDRLRLLKRAVDSGRRISDVAGRSDEELWALVQEDAAESASTPGPRPRAAGSGEAGRFVEAGLAAVERLDGDGLGRVLRHASVELSPPVLRHDVIGPLVETIGNRWRDGSLRVANEHLATAVIRSFLDGLRLGAQPDVKGPTVVVAAPAGLRHELGALLVAVAALEVGWQVVYLGCDLPAAEIAAAAHQSGARAIALSIVSPANDPRVAAELRELRDLVGESTVLFVGGASARSYDPVLERVGAQRIEDPRLFQDALEAI